MKTWLIICIAVIHTTQAAVKWKPKKINAWTGFKPVTSAILAQCSTNSAITPLGAGHISGCLIKWHSGHGCLLNLPAFGKRNIRQLMTVPLEMVCVAMKKPIRMLGLTSRLLHHIIIHSILPCFPDIFHLIFNEFLYSVGIEWICFAD